MASFNAEHKIQRENHGNNYNQMPVSWISNKIHTQFKALVIVATELLVHFFLN